MRQINGKTAAHRHFFSFFLYFIVDLRLSVWPNRLIVLKFWTFFLFSSRFPYFMLISEKRAVMITDRRKNDREREKKKIVGRVLKAGCLSAYGAESDENSGNSCLSGA